MVSIILNTKLCIIQFYSEDLAFVKSDLTYHPQVAIFLRGIFSKYLPEKLRAGGWGGLVGPRLKNMFSEIFYPFYMNFCICIDNMEYILIKN